MIAIFALLWIAQNFPFSATVRAADVSVNASLSSDQTEVGEPVEYRVTINGSQSAGAPQISKVDGLDIRYVGPSTQMQMNNFNVTLSVTHMYAVTPQRTGRFTIPAQTVDVGGKKFTTGAVTLNAGNAAGNSGAGGGTNEDNSSARSYFAELVLPKQSAFVGEAVPVELRIYVDTRIHWQIQEMPVISGEGFSIQKLTKPTQNQVKRNGRDFDLLTFKTAVTAAKTGNLKLGPATLDCLAQMPRARRARPRGLFDDPFGDDVFNDPFGMLAQPQKLTIASEPVEIDVKSLPQNAPKSFAGAVGVFTLATTASPEKVQIGDPITLTTKISGRGNFDRVSAPFLTDESGWRSYPPSAGKFLADDDVEISGAKTFETALIPNEKKTKLPPIRWTYFDPIKEKYITLSGDQPQIIVEGQPQQQQPIAANSANPANATAQPNATANPSAAIAQQPTPAPSDILFIRTDSGKWGESFEPIYERRGFWLAQIAPLAALLGLIGFRVRSARLSDARAQRLAKWRHEKLEAQRILRRSDANEQDFLDAAVRSIQLGAAMTNGREPATIDAAEACATRAFDSEKAARVRELFSARAELRYAGVSSGAQKISPERRANILKTINDFENADARA